MPLSVVLYLFLLLWPLLLIVLYVIMRVKYIYDVYATCIAACMYKEGLITSNIERTSIAW